MTDDITAPGVAEEWTRNLLHQVDANHGPCSWLMREDGSQVSWGDTAADTQYCRVHAAADLWDENELRCTCPCHDEQPALGHAGPAPAPVPEPRGPDTWPPPRDQAPPPTRPVQHGQQLDLYTPEDTP